MPEKTSVATAVRASNQLTRAWVERLRPDHNDVVSGAGAWLLLTALLHGATGKAREELEKAMFVAGERAASSVRSFAQLVASTEGTSSAAGVWLHRDVVLRPEYVREFPELTVASIPTDLALLDRWASDHTAGLITQFPGSITPDTRLVAATALAALAEWQQPFVDGIGQWTIRGGDTAWLSRSSADLNDATLLTRDATTISRVVCRTVDGFDVHLVAGPASAAPGEVLTLAIDALDGGVDTVVGGDLRVGDRGGCLVVENAPNAGPTPQLRVSLPKFSVSSEHDLLRESALFGLTAAQDTSSGHFPGLSPYPLAIACAAQSAVATFSAKGFKAAAVTMVAMVRAAGMMQSGKVVRVDFDRPFGFVVVERRHNLALFAGWVARPEPAS